MWEIIKDRLLWSLIILLISSWISYRISRHMLKKNLKSNLYIDELKEVKSFLKLSLKDIEENEEIFMGGHGYSYADARDIRHRIKNCSLNDLTLRNLLERYLQIIDEYNKEYSEYNKKHSKDPYEIIVDVVDVKERDRMLSAYRQSLFNLYQKINSRVEKIIT